MGIETLIGGALGLVGDAISSDSAGDAADTQAGAVRESNALQKQMYDQTRQDNMPALDARNSAISQLLSLYGLGQNNGSPTYGALTRQFTGADLANDPGYQFTRDQGLANIQNTAAARGGLYSGATLKALNKFNSGLADSTFTSAFNRDQQSKNQQANFLSNLAGLGSSITSGTQTMGANTAANIGSGLVGIGNAQAAAGVARGNIWGNAFNSAAANNGSGLNGAVNAFNSWRTLQPATPWARGQDTIDYTNDGYGLAGGF